MRKISISTELPLDAERACSMAQRAEVFRHVVWPVFGVRDHEMPEGFVLGAPFAARLWLAAGLLPGWRHEITVVEQTPTVLRTREHGGPLRVWNHELRFEPIGHGRCRYTDAVEIDAGALTAASAWIATALYRWRQRRWRQLATLVTSSECLPRP